MRFFLPSFRPSPCPPSTWKGVGVGKGQAQIPIPPPHRMLHPISLSLYTGVPRAPVLPRPRPPFADPWDSGSCSDHPGFVARPRTAKWQFSEPPTRRSMIPVSGRVTGACPRGQKRSPLVAKSLYATARRNPWRSQEAPVSFETTPILGASAAVVKWQRTAQRGLERRLREEKANA